MDRFYAKYKTQLFEFLLQLGLIALVFVFYTFEQENHKVTEAEVVLFLNYGVAAYLISYLLLPYFLYPKKYMLFFLLLSLTIGLVIYLEEFVIEQIYFPDTRGQRFHGILFSLVDTLPVITIITGFKFAWDALHKQKEVDQLKNSIQESELMYLKSQINPHFLFNNLNNIYAYALENSPKTPDIILELSAVLRYILYDSRAHFVPVSKEVNHLEDFVKLHELQLEHRGEVVFENKIENSGFLIAPLILPVFIENAFKHSPSSQSDNIFIKMDLNLSSDGKLSFFCKNNFSTQSNTASLSKGIGLENVKRRLELMYPNTHNLKIQLTENTYKVSLELQLQKMDS